MKKSGAESSTKNPGEQRHVHTTKGTICCIKFKEGEERDKPSMHSTHLSRVQGKLALPEQVNQCDQHGRQPSIQFLLYGTQCSPVPKRDSSTRRRDLFNTK